MTGDSLVKDSNEHGMLVLHGRDELRPDLYPHFCIF